MPPRTETPSRALRSIATTVAVTLSLLACGSNSSVQAASDCAGRAEFWRAIHQSYLDRLGDAGADELTRATGAVADAGDWLGNASLEFAREAEAFGCSAELRSGSTLICANAAELEARGPAGEAVVARLLDPCDRS